MRERFLAGEDVTEGVRPEVLLSWHRCRDDYAVDPFQERAPSAREREPFQVLEEKVAVTELAAMAKTIERDVEEIGALVAITDGRGGILAAWGDKTTLREADGANLVARCAWSEQGAGTNGMGTALMTEGPIMIRGPEHWCAGFHEWDCAGVAIREPVARKPLGALDISSPKPLPVSVVSWLTRAQQSIETGLRDQAVRTLRDLAAVYWQEERAARGPLAAADTGGRLLLANADARQYFGIARPDRGRDLSSELPQLHAALREAVERAQDDGKWVGVANLAVPGRNDVVPIAFRPALKERRLVGILLGAPGREVDGEAMALNEDAGGPSQPGRLVGLQGDRMVLVSADEIRYAEADGSYVWLDTDRGRLRVPERGMGALEQRLNALGFLRVHRHYLVNPKRVKEMAPGPNGSTRLVFDAEAGEPVPVARRRAAEVRRFLARR
jgi:hypothetical protein